MNKQEEREHNQAVRLQEVLDHLRRDAANTRWRVDRLRVAAHERIDHAESYGDSEDATKKVRTVFKAVLEAMTAYDKAWEGSERCQRILRQIQDAQMEAMRIHVTLMLAEVEMAHWEAVAVAFDFDAKHAVLGAIEQTRREDSEKELSI